MGYDLVVICEVVFFVMTSYQLSSYCCVCGVVALCVRILVRIILVSFMGMLVYRLVMSREARL